MISVIIPIYNVEHWLCRCWESLEGNSFAARHPSIVEIYFVRQVMGTLLWAMSREYENRKDVERVIREAENKYAGLRYYMQDKYVDTGKSLWGKLLLNGHFVIAGMYADVYELIRKVGRSKRNHI